MIDDNKNIFSIFQILTLKKEDIVTESDNMIIFKKLIRKHENMYPYIKDWLSNKVLPGISKHQRKAYIGIIDNKPIVSAIIKKSEDSKFCHLHIAEEYQNSSIGDLFFSMMALDVKRFANKVHFTLPESLWIEKKDFFKSFGFDHAVLAGTQYRLWDTELYCSIEFQRLWDIIVRNKLPKLRNLLSNASADFRNNLLMSIKPEYLKRILSGKKVIEIRKRFSKSYKGCRVTLYASQPTKSLLGYAIIKDIINVSPKSLWSQYGDLLGCSEKEFSEYTAGHTKIYGIFLSDIEPFTSPIPLTILSSLTEKLIERDIEKDIDKGLVPPQSYLKLSSDSRWAEAISISEFLHGRFKIKII